jgi:hypothetical protein
VSLLRRLVVTGVLVSFAFAPSGCSAGDVQGAQASSLGPTPSLPPYTVPTVAPRAVTATTSTQDASVDFVLAYLDALNYGYAHGDADPLRTMSALSCAPCVNWIKDIETRKSTGARQSGGVIRIVGMRSLGASSGAWAFRASLWRESGTTTLSSGTATPLSAQAELVDILVAPQTSALTGSTTWQVVAITPAPTT